MTLLTRIRRAAKIQKRNLVKSARLSFHTALRNRMVPEWVVPVDQPVVWVCQPARSGGTMLIRLFDGHPQVHVRPVPVNFGRSRGWPDDPIRDLAKLRGIFSLARFNRRGFAKGASNEVQDAMPVYFDERWFRTILARGLRTASTGRQIFDALNTATFNAWRNYQNLYGPKNNVVFHSVLNPDVGLGVAYENFFQSYPDGYVIFTARNPEDWLASAVKLEKSNRYIVDMETALDSYVKYFTAIKQSADERVIVLEFDDLVRHPRNNLERLCQRFGIQYRETLETTTMNRMPLSPNSSYETAKAFAPDLSVLGRGAAIREEASKLEQFPKAWALFEEVAALAGKTAAAAQ